jgi:hypothetical protein
LEWILKVNVVTLIEDHAGIIDLVLWTRAVARGLEHPINIGYNLVRNGISATGAVLPATTRDDPFNLDPAVHSSERYSNEGRSLKNDLPALRALYKSFVERLKGEGGLYLHPREGYGRSADSHE